MIRGCLWNWAPWVYNKVESIVDTVKRMFKASYSQIGVSTQWYILNNIDVPIHSSIFPKVPDSPLIWTCTTSPPRFIPSLSVTSETKHISYLSFTVMIPGHETLDLTEWLNTVQWSGSREPSIKHIFQLWCCDTGQFYFHLIPYIQVKLINEMGDEIIKGLNDSSISISSTNGGSRIDVERSNSDRSLDALLSSSGC